MPTKSFTLSALFCMFFFTAPAAFPVKLAKQIHATGIQQLNCGENNQSVGRHVFFIPRFFRRSYDGGYMPQHRITYKSRLLASVLAFIGIYPFTGLFGLHRLYLGYTWQGVVQLLAAPVGGVAIALSLLAAISPALMIAGVSVGIAIIAGAFVWQIVDYARIRAHTLGPKWGYYRDDVKRVMGKD